MSYHTIASYALASDVVSRLYKQLGQPLVMVVDDRLQQEMDQASLSKQGKLMKRYHQTMREIDHVSGSVHTLQIEMRNLVPNLSFVLKNAHNATSYRAVARYFATFDHLSKRIKREQRSVKHPELDAFIAQADVLEVNFFDAMLETVHQMAESISHRRQCHPQEYRLCEASDLEVDFDALKGEYKATIKQLKESQS